jgi:hypothetical protein
MVEIVNLHRADSRSRRCATPVPAPGNALIKINANRKPSRYVQHIPPAISPEKFVSASNQKHPPVVVKQKQDATGRSIPPGRKRKSLTETACTASQSSTSIPFKEIAP